MKRSLSGGTVDWEDQFSMHLEHNRQIEFKIEKLKKQLKIKNHNNETMSMHELKYQMKIVLNTVTTHGSLFVS